MDYGVVAISRLINFHIRCAGAWWMNRCKNRKSWRRKCVLCIKKQRTPQEGEHQSTTRSVRWKLSTLWASFPSYILLPQSCQKLNEYMNDRSASSDALERLPWEGFNSADLLVHHLQHARICAIGLTLSIHPMDSRRASSEKHSGRYNSWWFSALNDLILRVHFEVFSPFSAGWKKGPLLHCRQRRRNSEL